LSATPILGNLQVLLARLYDVPLTHHAEDFLICDRRRLNALLGVQIEADEQVLLVQQV